MTNWIIKSTVSMALACTFASTAFAQGSPKPKRSVESFGAWEVECNRFVVTPAKVKKADPKKADKIKDVKSAKVETITHCEATQSYSNSRTKKEVARLAFAYDGEGKSKKLTLFMRTFTNVNFTTNPALYSGDVKIVDGKFTHCAGNYCYGKFPIDAAIIDKIAKSDKPSWRYHINKTATYPINIGKDGMKDAIALLKTK